MHAASGRQSVNNENDCQVYTREPTQDNKHTRTHTQVEHRYQREQHTLRSFVFATAKGMLKDVNMDRALSAADLYSDSDSE